MEDNRYALDAPPGAARMNNHTPRAGDRALVLPDVCAPNLKKYIGKIVPVLTDPYVAGPDGNGQGDPNQNDKYDWGIIVCDIVDGSCYWAASRLIRIPPDSESKRLFSETEHRKGQTA